MSTKLDREFYLQPTIEVAHALIGKQFVTRAGRQTLSGRIVEAEAYIGESDPACHACRGKTRRNSVMYEHGGLTYVYFVYGMYNMLNFVTGPEGHPAAVLIRALEPLEGIRAMQRRRGRSGLTDLTSGPGKICQAFAIDVRHSGRDLTNDSWYVLDSGDRPENIGASARIGIRDGVDRLWRFYDADSRFVSSVKRPQLR
jgi:DNA-3-methyladenine glycosylase